MSQHPALRVATRRDGSRDGELMLVNASGTRWTSVSGIARTLQQALDDWSSCASALAARHRALEDEGWRHAEPFVATDCLAPLPRAYQWADASVYRNHARLIYQWRREPIPASYETEPLVYQGGSDMMLPGHAPIVAVDEAHGIDLEAEIGIITTDVPMGTDAQQALQHIALVVLLNDISLRGLIPSELTKGFGFYQSKPATSFAPIAVTPAALGPHWRNAMLQLPVQVRVNDAPFGRPHAGEETVFHFGQIIAHLCKTRSLGAGTIVGAGTISNAAAETGSACITEARVRQILTGVAEPDLQPYLRDGDRVGLEVLDDAGRSVFGAIDQTVQIQKTGRT